MYLLLRALHFYEMAHISYSTFDCITFVFHLDRNCKQLKCSCTRLYGLNKSATSHIILIPFWSDLNESLCRPDSIYWQSILNRVFAVSLCPTVNGSLLVLTSSWTTSNRCNQRTTEFQNKSDCVSHPCCPNDRKGRPLQHFVVGLMALWRSLFASSNFAGIVGFRDAWCRHLSLRVANMHCSL